MVKSGLDPTIIEKKEIPRVSQYRLAAHLSLAFIIYILMLKQGLNTLHPMTKTLHFLPKVGSHSDLDRFRILTLLSTKLVFLTAISGSFFLFFSFLFFPFKFIKFLLF
jgi:cytochrome c oxidase assembly protein subunit 15